MIKTREDWTPCADCNRGGRGNGDKCSAGWYVTDLNGLGCYIGEPIIGEPRKPPKMTRAQKNYRDFLRADTGWSFAEWMGFKLHNGRAVR